MAVLALREQVRRWYRRMGQPNFLRWLQWGDVRRMLVLAEHHVLIDLGCGSLAYAARLAKEPCGEVVAVDFDLPGGINQIADRYGIKLVQADAQKLPFRDASANRILASSLLHMVPQPERLLDECRRVLKSDGRLVLSVPNDYQFISALYRSALGRPLCRWLTGMEDIEALTAHLNRVFGVRGPRGYYSRTDLYDLLDRQGFSVREHCYSPGLMGSAIWEIGVLAHVRFGNVAFHALMLLYPMARLLGARAHARNGSEHLVSAVVTHDSRSDTPR